MSQATLRRDLQILEEQRLLRRTHGGALAQDVLYELPVRYRHAQHREQKRRIAAEVVKRIPEGPTAVGLTGGTTTSEVARLLVERTDLTVVTNALEHRGRAGAAAAAQAGRDRRGEPVAVLRAGRALGRAHAARGQRRARGHRGRRDQRGGWADHPRRGRGPHRRDLDRAGGDDRSWWPTGPRWAGCCWPASPASADVDELVTDDSVDPVALQALRAAGLKVTVV